MKVARQLQVLLQDQAIGTLSLVSDDRVEFRLLESYKSLYPRPVLGQQFLDDVDQVQRSRSRVPAWFSNLLPEGVLRDLIARQVGVASTREYFLLAHLGEDLPGAVRLIADGEAPLSEVADEEAGPLEQASEAPWHFSLAGVQLKFSACRDGKGLTIPVSGRGGDWIVKLPDARYAGVPENEFATMAWARASGIDTPPFELIPIDEIGGLPTSFSGPPGARMAYAVQRFDRGPNGARVHMEDFAQVLNLYPERKYERANFETLAKIILALGGEAALQDFVLRLVFMLASGNGDAHLKNWSLLYPDGHEVRQTPAYDLVSTIQYWPKDRLALNLGGSKDWGDMDWGRFQRIGRRLEIPDVRWHAMLQASIGAVLDAWRLHQRDFGYDTPARTCLQAHMASVPLLR